MELIKINNKSILTARAGTVLKLIGDTSILGEKVCLGYVYYKNGKKLKMPVLATPDMFEEVDIINNSAEAADIEGDNA